LNKWLKNISSSLAGKLMAMLFLTLLDIFAARLLAVEEYAEWVYFFSILTMMFYVGWFGINVSTKVFISKSIDERDRVNCLKASILLRLVASIIIAIIIEIVMPVVSIYLGYPDKYPDLKWLLQFSAILVFLNSFTELFKEINIGTNKFKNLFVVIVTEYIGYFLFSVAALYLSKNVKGIAVGYAISGILVGVIAFCMLYGEHNKYFDLIDDSYKTKILPILKYAVPIALISFSGMVLVEMDTFMLGMLGTKEDVAVYSIAKNLSTKASHINNAITIGVMTSFSVIDYKNVFEKKKKFQKASLMNIGATIFVAAMFLIFARIAISILYGETYIKASIILRLLVVYYALYGISNFYSTFLDFRNKAGIRSVCYLIAAVVNLMLDFLWIPRYGAYGAVLATELSLLPYTIFVIIITMRVWRKLEKNP
jgi:O-antigen/teichoic acid export membrane protein